VYCDHILDNSIIPYWALGESESQVFRRNQKSSPISIPLERFFSTDEKGIVTI